MKKIKGKKNIDISELEEFVFNITDQFDVRDAVNSEYQSNSKDFDVSIHWQLCFRAWRAWIIGAKFRLSLATKKDRTNICATTVITNAFLSETATQSRPKLFHLVTNQSVSAACRIRL